MQCHITFGGVWRVKIEPSGPTRYERDTGPDCGCSRLECFSKIAVNNEALNH